MTLKAETPRVEVRGAEQPSRRGKKLKRDLTRAKESALSRARLLELFDVDTAAGVLTRKVSRGGQRAGSVAGSDNGKGYMVTTIDDKSYKNHRLVFFAHYGRWPHDQLDHINGRKTDNRIANLREVDNQGNMRNAALPSHNTSGICGVSWNKRCGKWTAQIKVDGEKIHLGYFDDILGAILARWKAEEKYNFHPNHGRPPR